VSARLSVSFLFVYCSTVCCTPPLGNKAAVYHIEKVNTVHCNSNCKANLFESFEFFMLLNQILYSFSLSDKCSITIIYQYFVSSTHTLNDLVEIRKDFVIKGCYTCSSVLSLMPERANKHSR
jgi:hypothetical protein